ncbi:ATP-binding protein [Streptomyces sp. B6B3]|uniref:ATP-binding protein n=1 Tax=Streptomyces sp. B6B3 TaxID=3153570 RepID=UPI00325C9F63
MERVELVVAELAANAVFHGQVGGRDFRLASSSTPPPWGGPRRGHRRARRPPARPVGSPVANSSAERGRGLLLVAALADRWGTRPCPPDGKTVWAELAQKRCL